MADSSEDRISRGDMVLIRKAIRQKWELPEGIMKAVPRQVSRVLLTGNNREQLSAAKTMAMLKAHNDVIDAEDRPAGSVTSEGTIEADPHEQRRRAEIFEVAQRLGLRIAPVEPDTGERAESGPDSDIQSTEEESEEF